MHGATVPIQKEYYKRVVIIPFLDHLISELTSRFDAHAKKASIIQRLLPKRLSSVLIIYCGY